MGRRRRRRAARLWQVALACGRRKLAHSRCQEGAILPGSRQCQPEEPQNAFQRQAQQMLCCSHISGSREGTGVVLFAAEVIPMVGQVPVCHIRSLSPGQASPAWRLPNTFGLQRPQFPGSGPAGWESWGLRSECL
uniref:Uncharacterized protein n=1 Tax=Varanus komodoensis TaxID=61221 RepID=A0A8D2L1T4_VARKO